MLTGMVNIAVFAAFRCVITVVLRSNAEFKPVCRERPLDVSRYGWQKRQEVATKWQGGWQKRHGLAGCGVSTPPCVRLRVGKMGWFARICDCQGAGAAGCPCAHGTNLP